MNSSGSPVTAMIMGSNDNVAVLLEHVKKRETICAAGQGNTYEIAATSDVPRFHKVALRPVLAGALVIRHDTAIGAATINIMAGEWVHTHNIRSLRGEKQQQSRSRSTKS